MVTVKLLRVSHQRPSSPITIPHQRTAVTRQESAAANWFGHDERGQRANSLQAQRAIRKNLKKHPAQRHIESSQCFEQKTQMITIASASSTTMTNNIYMGVTRKLPPLYLMLLLPLLLHNANSTTAVVVVVVVVVVVLVVLVVFVATVQSS